jgi:hypothetical protein
VEENIEETLTYFRLPLAHRKHMKSTNMLERLNEEIRRRTYVVRIEGMAQPDPMIKFAELDVHNLFGSLMR